MTKDTVQQMILGCTELDFATLLDQLVEWQQELEDDWDDNIRFAMIDTFIDMIFDNLKE